MSHDIEVRRATPADEPAVLALLAVSLGWKADDPMTAMFGWKHLDNHFGASPAWVAVDGDRLAGYRTFMRWRFRRNDATVEAVRAVDTATHPDYRGRGLFRLLTTQALEDLRDEGVSFVFNTPNDQSRPGYLKMGWQVVGRLPVAARPRGATGLARMAQARKPAALWSTPCPVGEPAADVFQGGSDFVRPAASRDELSTDRSAGYLTWRFGFEPMHYRVWSTSAASLVFRLRSRGAATELAVLETFGEVRGGDVAKLLRATKADYAVGLGVSRPARAVAVPGQGPLLTWRALASSEMPAADAWRLSLGDIELF